MQAKNFVQLSIWKRKKSKAKEGAMPPFHKLSQVSLSLNKPDTL